MELDDVTLVAEGLRAPEGPVAMPDGSVLLVELLGHTLTRVTPDGKVAVVAEVGGGPNGAAIGPDGAAYLCNNGGLSREDRIAGCIQRVDLSSGHHEVLYDNCDGEPLGAPNDLVFDEHGGFWFTDHGTILRGTITPGAVYYAAADGSSIRKVLPRVERPNGIGLSPDGGTLYYALTPRRQVMRRKVTAPGELAPTPGVDLLAYFRTQQLDPSVVLAGLPGYQELDSLAVDSDGNVCVGTLVEGCVSVFAPDGTVEQVRLPDEFADVMLTNLCFGGADLRTVYLTLAGTGRLVRGTWPRPGLRLAYQELPG
jgi:gluconolactonase